MVRGSGGGGGEVGRFSVDSILFGGGNAKLDGVFEAGNVVAPLFGFFGSVGLVGLITAVSVSSIISLTTATALYPPPDLTILFRRFLSNCRRVGLFWILLLVSDLGGSLGADGSVIFGTLEVVGEGVVTVTEGVEVEEAFIKLNFSKILGLFVLVFSLISLFSDFLTPCAERLVSTDSDEVSCNFACGGSKIGFSTLFDSSAKRFSLETFGLFSSTKNFGFVDGSSLAGGFLGGPKFSIDTDLPIDSALLYPDEAKLVFREKFVSCENSMLISQPESAIDDVSLRSEFCEDTFRFKSDRGISNVDGGCGSFFDSSKNFEVYPPVNYVPFFCDLISGSLSVLEKYV